METVEKLNAPTTTRARMFVKTANISKCHYSYTDATMNASTNRPLYVCHLSMSTKVHRDHACDDTRLLKQTKLLTGRSGF
jgi:hypothetical protein